MANELVPYEPPPVPALVDSRGRPLVRREELERDMAGASVMGGRSVQTGHPADGLTPERLARILRQAENGDATAYLELAEQMEEKDLHYLSVLGTRKRQVSQLPVTVIAASDSAEDEADAQLVRDWVERDTLEGELFDMLDSIGKSYSATEIVWDTSSQPWLPVRLEWRDPRWFEFHQVDGRTLLLKDGAERRPLQPGKWIVHEGKAKSGIPIRGGFARPVAWAYMFRNYAIKDWNRFNEAYGMPLRVAKYEAGTDDLNIRKMLRALIGMSADFAAAFPKSADVEFVKGEMGGSGNLFQDLAVYFEQQISKAVLGQTATTDSAPGGLGSGAQASTHNEVRGDIERADAKSLASAINAQLVQPMVIFNRGVRKRYPRLFIGKPDEQDVKEFRASVDQGVKLGVPIAVSTWRKGTGIAEPKDGEELLQAPAADSAEEPAPEQSGATARRKPARPFLEPLKGSRRPVSTATAAAGDGAAGPGDEIDQAGLAAIDDWERLIAPTIRPIELLAGDAASLEDLRDRLDEAFEGMDVSAIADQLANAAFAARVAGHADTAAAEED